ncbi:MAG TPA: hypothetical protein VFZ61_06500, partial [Polyangiales bacterium]
MRRLWPLVCGLAATLALTWPALQPGSARAQTTQARTPITRADQLPRRSYTLPRLPSELLEGPLSELMPLADALEHDMLADQARFEIKDQATLRAMVGTRINIALLRSDWTAVAPLAVQLRALQDKPGPKLTSGVLSELVAQAKRERKGADALQTAVSDRFGEMPWGDVQDSIKAMKGQLEITLPALVIGGVRSQADEAARNANLRVDESVVAGLIGARAQLDHLLPLRAAIVAGLAP